jgi:glycosyltransferase involved in cell wall biosynthesis
LSGYLNACDIGLISFKPGMCGVSVPSRMYNIMAAGKPILAIADSDSELARVVREERIGWVVDPGNSRAISAAMVEAKSSPEELIAMGLRARNAAESKYCFDKIIGKYRNLFAQI